MKKIFRSALALILIVAFVTGLCACGKSETISGEQALEVYVWDAGYGTQWCADSLAAFAEQDWVKEKYPNLQYKLVSNDQHNYADGRITSGSANSIDLFFASSLSGTFEDYCLDLTASLYNAQVPGEDILYKDKVRPYLLEAFEYRNQDGERTGQFYSGVLSSGLTSYVYNKTLFEDLGLAVPRTTDELIELCETVKNMGGTNPAYPHTTTIISSKVAYSDRLQDLWWAQYDTLTGYQNYWNAIAPDGTRNSVDIFEQAGRLECAKVFEALYKEENGYYDRTSVNYDFIQGQTRLLIGEGLMMVCGEWFSTEMRDLAVEYQSRGYDYDIGMMPVPIISSIIDHTPTITDDEMLRQVISDIDVGLTEPSNAAVSAEDYARVRSARGMVTTRDTINSHAVVPNYADGQQIAVDFLLFLATDEACSIYAEKTYGGTSAFQFDLKTDNPTLHEKLQQEYGKTYTVLSDVSDMMNVEFAQGVYVYSPMKTFAGFTAWPEKYKNLEQSIVSNAGLTAQQIVDLHDSYWLDDNASNFQKALTRAGLA